MTAAPSCRCDRCGAEYLPLDDGQRVVVSVWPPYHVDTYQLCPDCDKAVHDFLQGGSQLAAEHILRAICGGEPTLDNPNLKRFLQSLVDMMEKKES